MGLSLFFAKFLGIYMLIIAAIWLTRKKQFEIGIKDILSSDGLLALSGAIHLVVGLIIAISHPIWEWNWRGLITLIAYISIIQGIIRLTFPNESKKAIIKSLVKGSWVWILVLVVLGVILTYNGFTGHEKASSWWFFNN